MGKPAARIGDDHECPKATPGTPPVLHVGGPVIGPGCLTVLIEGMPAARVGDNCFCVGEPDTIATGSSGVFIGGLPAARMGDSTEHGGKVITGCGTVLIGAVMGGKLFIGGKDIKIDMAIKKSIVLLENKIRLLEQSDPITLEAFMKWFGLCSKKAKDLILERMKKILHVSKQLTVNNFIVIRNEKEKRDSYANSYPNDIDHTLLLGDLFWEKSNPNKTKAGVIIHELSHFNKIGKTEDVMYGQKRCLKLAKTDPDLALINAESFEYFVIT